MSTNVDEKTKQLILKMEELSILKGRVQQISRIRTQVATVVSKATNDGTSAIEALHNLLDVELDETSSQMNLLNEKVDAEEILNEEVAS
jgi:hypothetical protein